MIGEHGVAVSLENRNYCYRRQRGVTGPRSAIDKDIILSILRLIDNSLCILIEDIITDQCGGR